MRWLLLDWGSYRKSFQSVGRDVVVGDVFHGVVLQRLGKWEIEDISLLLQLHPWSILTVILSTGCRGAYCYKLIVFEIHWQLVTAAFKSGRC